VLIGFAGVLKAGVHASIGGLCGTPTLAVEVDAFVVKVAAGAMLPVRGGAGDTPWNLRATTTIAAFGLGCAVLSLGN